MSVACATRCGGEASSVAVGVLVYGFGVSPPRRLPAKAPPDQRPATPAVPSTSYFFTRSMYAPVRVSTLIQSPWLTKSGTRTSAPELTVAGLREELAVSPLTPGSV